MNKRKHHRVYPDAAYRVNEGVPYTGGIIHDISEAGMAVSYPEITNPIPPSLKLGQTLLLVVNDCISYQAKVVRIFQNGFACQFSYCA